MHRKHNMPVSDVRELPESKLFILSTVCGRSPIRPGLFLPRSQSFALNDLVPNSGGDVLPFSRSVIPYHRMSTANAHRMRRTFLGGFQDYIAGFDMVLAPFACTTFDRNQSCPVWPLDNEIFLLCLDGDSMSVNVFWFLPT